MDKKHYFEGWYYKQVTADEQTAISFIPAVSLIDGDKHSFIQYIFVQTTETGEKSAHTGYVRYPIDQFHYQQEPFVMQIGESVFSEQLVSVQLHDEKMTISGKLGLGDFHPIQTSLLQPSIMGFVGYIPRMECYHGVISMTHTLQGSLSIDGQEVDFTGGKGYLEKDWGTSFPQKYIWLQSNHFENPTASFFFSVVDVPVHITTLEGFTSGYRTNAPAKCLKEPANRPEWKSWIMLKSNMQSQLLYRAWKSLSTYCNRDSISHSIHSQNPF
ncbi:tocopherol cyclase family protein [Atopococcus tabaci]|uniref:tocopherol cyclase family protein n=1 Tax=Atopococcus tabaci TaxID=269774 RepID=UPI000411F817|nr:tocopherol cyclase family protein [Atopococcus tabaci]